MPSAFPALGHDVSTDYRTHPVDLSAQKLNLSAPNQHAGATGAFYHPIATRTTLSAYSICLQ